MYRRSCFLFLVPFLVNYHIMELKCKAQYKRDILDHRQLPNSSVIIMLPPLKLSNSMDIGNSSTGLNETDEYVDYGEYGNEKGLVVLCELESYDEITAASYIVICCCSLFGNSLLLYSLARFKNLRRVTTVFILCLALFDLLFTLTLPFWAVDNLHQWIFGDVACKLLIGAYFVGIYGSLILLTAMTVDRFFTIVVRSPWLTRRRRLNGARAACVGAWVISIGACLKDALSSKSKVKGLSYICASSRSEADNTEYYAQLVLLFFLPLVIIVFCYGKILHTLMSTATKQKYRTVLVVLCIVVAFIVCWGPYHVLMIINTLHKPKECQEKAKLNQAYVACRILAYGHCCVNPLLYMLRGRSRKVLHSLLCCSSESRQDQQNTEPSNSNIIHNLVVERVDKCEASELSGHFK